jgi:uncharacterized membrane protein
MDLRDRLLVRKLAIVLVIKLVVLSGLWWGFVRHQRVSVNTDAAVVQMLGPIPVPQSPTDRK